MDAQMLIDLPTLMVAGSFIAAISGIFLVFAWLQNRESWAMLWWAAANLILAASVPLMAVREGSLGRPAEALAITLLNLSPALIWAAARSCNNRHASRTIIVAGAALWLAAFLLPGFRASPDAQTFFNLSIIALYLFAAGAEFWRGRAERLGSRWPLIVLLLSHSAIFAIGAIEALAGGLPLTGNAPLSSWFGFIHFEALVFVVGTAIFIVAIDRERGELRQKILASIDELTGVASRRAFFDEAEQLLASCQEEDLPFSLIVFDLDRFKEINDTHGHMTGDLVLEVFGDSVREALRAGDLVGRPGGEEFAVAMPGASAGTAYVMAERIRISFAERCRRLGTLRLSPTVSAGVTTAHPKSTLDTMFATADRALYRAKQLGRDRIEMDDRRWPAEPQASEPMVAMQVA
jgi:diguanylate cyclase (GGDEF)-like protein